MLAELCLERSRDASCLKQRRPSLFTAVHRCALASAQNWPRLYLYFKWTFVGVKEDEKFEIKADVPGVDKTSIKV
jgi:HSP20 family molecular chaperone IbpA